MRLCVLVGLGLVAMAAPAGAETFDELAESAGSTYYLLRVGDIMLGKCTGVPSGEASAGDGKRVTWNGVGDIKRRREMCQQQMDGLKLKIRQQHPTLVKVLEQAFDEQAPKIEKQAREQVNSIVENTADERLACWMQNEVYAFSADTSCN